MPVVVGSGCHYLWLLHSTEGTGYDSMNHKIQMLLVMKSIMNLRQDCMNTSTVESFYHGI